MIDIDLPQAEVQALKRSIETLKRKLPNELAIAVNETTHKTRRAVQDSIKNKVAIKAGTIAKSIRKGSRASKMRLRSAVIVGATARLPLKEFGPNQTAAGVTYKIEKRGARKLVTDSFMGPTPRKRNPKLGGHAFKRRGATRYPIDKLHGISPWGTYVRSGMDTPTRAEATDLLRARIMERVRVNLLRADGTIKR